MLDETVVTGAAAAAGRAVRFRAKPECRLVWRRDRPRFRTETYRRPFTGFEPGIAATARGVDDRPV